MAGFDSARHTGRVAIVTGAGSGIGRAATVRLAREGATVVACDLQADGLAGTAAAVQDAGGSVVTVEADVTRPEDIERLFTTAMEQVGRIDVLANVAGIMDWLLPAHEIDDETWARVLNVNITVRCASAGRCCRA